MGESAILRTTLLSPREMAVAERLIDGWTAHEIAADLGISFHTVRTHIRNIYIKAGVANRVELVRWTLPR